MNTQNKINKMLDIKIESVTLHCSTADPKALEKRIKLLKLIAKENPVKTLSKKRIPGWKISPGMPIGCKVDVRKQKAVELLKILFTGINSLKKKQFNPGLLSFGIKEYIEIPSLSYQRDIGITGFDVAVTLKRAGWRINDRKRFKSKIPAKHRISRAETIEFFKNNFNINIED